jgi:hypothetical protein
VPYIAKLARASLARPLDRLRLSQASQDLIGRLALAGGKDTPHDPHTGKFTSNPGFATRKAPSKTAAKKAPAKVLGGRRVRAGEAKLRPGDKRNVSRALGTDLKNPRGIKMSNSEQGRTFEGLLMNVGLGQMNRLLGTKGVTRISSAKGGSTTTPIDIAFGDITKPARHFMGELKTRSITAKEGKSSISAKAMARKIEAAQKTKARPLTVIQVVDQKTKTVSVHVIKDEFKSFRYNNRKPEFTYKYTDAQLEKAWHDVGYPVPPKAKKAAKKAAAKKAVAKKAVGRAR